MWKDTIELRMGHSLRYGNAPDLPDRPFDFKKLEEVAKPVDVQSFGLFSDSNFHDFHPGIKIEDLAIKDEDYLYPIYRALSEVTVHKKYNPIDFSSNGALKKSMYLLKGQSVKGDHEDGIRTSIGAVKDVEWENETKQGSILIPAGINARLKIDKKVSPGITRLIDMDPPGIHSTSATVTFKWDKSHPSMPQDEFLNKLGTYDKDGKQIKRMVVEILNYSELSLVDHGADPFAKKKDAKGNLVLIEHADRVYNTEEKMGQKHFFYNFKDTNQDTVQNSEEDTIPDDSNTITTSNSEIMNKEFMIALAAVLGLTYDENKPDELKAAITKLKTEKDAADAKVVELQQKVTAETEVTELKEFKTKTLSALRAEATTALNKLHDNKPPQGLVDLISNTTTADGLQALISLHNTELEKKFPLSCGKCGGTVTRASAKAEDTNESNEGGKEETKPLSLDEIKEKFTKRSQTVAWNLHDEDTTK